MLLFFHVPPSLSLLPPSPPLFLLSLHLSFTSLSFLNLSHSCQPFYFFYLLIWYLHTILPFDFFLLALPVSFLPIRRLSFLLSVFSLLVFCNSCHYSLSCLPPFPASVFSMLFLLLSFSCIHLFILFHSLLFLFSPALSLDFAVLFPLIVLSGLHSYLLFLLLVWTLCLSFLPVVLPPPTLLLSLFSSLVSLSLWPRAVVVVKIRPLSCH